MLWNSRRHPATSSAVRRLAVNITPAERIGRIAIGTAAVLAGAVLLASAVSALATVLEVLLIAAGMDLIVTGGLGHCPLYQKLGHVPRSLRTSI
jgi:hypothetical protein